MILPGVFPQHLTYCLNVHPGESLTEQEAAIQGVSCRVRDRIAPHAPAFGLGLRLGEAAAAELAAPGRLPAFAEFLRGQGLYAFSINGFPQGHFHGRRVKQAVYEPDWSCPERLEYTCRLLDILAGLLPEDTPGSISTVPLGAYAALADPGPLDRAARHLAAAAAHAHAIEQRTGRTICLGLEPEPGCRLETTEETIDVYTHHLLPVGMAWLREEVGLEAPAAEALLRRHLGICFDTCHQALACEDLATSLDALRDAGIPIPKIQLSAALETLPTPEAREALAPFDEPVYLHQTRWQRADGCILGHEDLPALLHDPAPWAAGTGLLRVHMHVPLFWEGTAPLRSTRHTLDAAFWQRLQESVTPHLEIETYTFHVLPDTFRQAPLDESIAAEYEWILSHHGTPSPTA